MTESSKKRSQFTAHFSRWVAAEFIAGGYRAAAEPCRRCLAQRSYGRALGLQRPQRSRGAALGSVAGAFSGKRELDEPLAGKSTLNRLKLTGRSALFETP
jgi:hypothetical protein